MLTTLPVTSAGTVFVIEGSYDGRAEWADVKAHWHSNGWWNGHLVSVWNDPEYPPCETHELHQIDNYGHPVNELWCYDCLGVALDPEPRPCTNADCWHHKEPGWCEAQQDGCVKE